MTNAERDCKRIADGIREAIAHGHPNWSHLFAYGPCKKESKVR